MKSLIASILVLGLVGMVVGVAVKAETESSVTATVTPAFVSVAVDPTSTDYGVMDVNETKKADTADPNDAFIVTNSGSSNADLNIRGTSSIDWTLGDTRSSEQFVHAYSALVTLTAGNVTEPVSTSDANKDTAWVTLGTSNKTLGTAAANNGTEEFVLAFLTPSTTAVTSQQSTTVTIQATIQ